MFICVHLWPNPSCLPPCSLAGCQTAHVAHPLTETTAGNDPDAQLEFWHTLASRPVASNDEAFHGVLLYLDQQDPAKDYAGRVQLLKSRKMLSSGFDKPADEAVTRGTLAVILVQAAQIKGGVIMQFTGPSERYATRELEFANLYPQSSPNQTFSGSEFLGIIGRLEDYQRVNPAEAPAALLPSEIQGQKQTEEIQGNAPAPGNAVPSSQPSSH